MAKYLIAFVLVVGYAAGSVWLVGREGAAHRDGLRRARLASGTSAPRSGATETEMGPAPALSRAREVEAPKPEVSRTAMGGDGGVAVVKVDPSPTIPARTPVPAPTGKVVEPAAPKGAGDPLWAAPLMKRVWDLSKLDDAGERDLGRELHEVLMVSLRKAGAGSQPRRVETLAEPFVAARERKGIEYTFTVIESDAVNAFSHPGGYVYVTTGLLNWLGEDETSALEFILAHEIAHVDLRHALACLNQPNVKKLGYGTLPQFLILILPRGYWPERLDFEADRWAFTQMARLDRTKRQQLSFLRRLDGYANENGFGNGEREPKPDADAMPVDNHIKAHPAPYKRLKELEKLTKEAAAPPPAAARVK